MLINENELKKMLNKYRFIFCFCVIMLYKMELMYKGYQMFVENRNVNF